MDSLRAQVEARRRQEESAFAEEQSKKGKGGPGGPDDPSFVAQCLACNELGDGVLFVSIHRGRFLFDASAGEWLVWSGHHWSRDITGRSLAAVEDVAMAYLGSVQAIGRKVAATSDEEEVERLQKRQAKFLKRIDRLRSVRGRQNCLTFAATCGEGAMVVTGDQLDSQPWLLPCRNGVVDLRVGELRPGDPKDFMTKGATVDFPEGCEEYLVTGQNSPCPNWEAFVLEVMGGDQAKADYLARLFGYAITGLVLEHVFAVLFGHGRNGKGTMIETLQKILGPLASPVPAELLLDQGKVSNPAGPSPHLMALRGLRLAFCSETDQGRRFSAARVKWLSGGDSLTGRHPHDRQPTTFSPSHLLCLATNHKPRADASDFAFWSRLHLIEFGLSYVDRPIAAHERKIDKSLPDRLAVEESGILAWLVRGCLLWQAEGLNPPPAVLAATAEYRQSEDDLFEWIEEKCVEGDGFTITAKQAYQSFREWWIANVSDKPPSQKRFGDGMCRRGYGKDRGAGGGAVRYLGLGLKSLA
ncbi:DNA primase family protein [Desulfuromonas sp. DDH964]|uniref:DNA primase family protein n=1 Tax=Desulfuromonas sp. DDH964 TaxID=1823759 RepID=UPI0018D45D43|nr:phage/plasmid primase, P4 family [Desulfuromonas sp. DDH964]